MTTTILKKILIFIFQFDYNHHNQLTIEFLLVSFFSFFLISNEYLYNLIELKYMIELILIFHFSKVGQFLKK